MLGEMLQVDDAMQIMDEFYQDILAVIMLRIGAAATDKNAAAQKYVEDWKSGIFFDLRS